MAIIRRTRPAAKLVRRSRFQPFIGLDTRVTHPAYPQFGAGRVDAIATFKGVRMAFVHCDNRMAYAKPVAELKRVS